MNKLDIATQILLKLIETNERGYDPEGIAGYAWEIADAMQAEADKREPKGLPEVLQDDWQPDWSVAPDWANWWVVTSVGSPCWTDSKPRISDDGNYWCLSRGTSKAPSFDYQGDWRKSLRKRPQ